MIDDYTNEKIMTGMQIRIARTRHNLMSQRELANAVGLHPNTVCNVERGNIRGLESRQKITRYFERLENHEG